MLHYEPNQRVQSKNNGKPGKCVLKPMRTLNGLEFIKGFLRGPILLTPSSLPSFLLALRLEIFQTNRVQNSTRSLVQHSSHFTLHTFHMFNAPHFPHAFHFSLSVLPTISISHPLHL